MASVLQTLRLSMAAWGRDAVGFVYPPACVVCAAELRPGADAAARHERFCAGCRDRLQCRLEHACLSCGAPVGPNLQGWKCRHCRKDNFAFDGVVALGVYEAELKGACQRAKQPHGAPVTAGLSELLFEAHEATLTAAELDAVVPVPHHWWERLTHPHRPPMTMAGVMSRRLSIPMAPHILAKRRRTRPQSSLPPVRRRKNLRDAFCVAEGQQLAGTNVLLTDDILTTGTTADRAARALKQAGVQRVLVAVLARGIGRRSSERS